MQMIPKNENRVVVLAGDDQPLLPLFRPYSLHRKLLFLPPHAAPPDLNQLDIRYVVIGGGAEVEYPELCEYLKTTNDYELMMQQDYTYKLARGPDTWRLYQRRQITNEIPPNAHLR